MQRCEINSNKVIIGDRPQLILTLFIQQCLGHIVLCPNLSPPPLILSLISALILA